MCRPRRISWRKDQGGGDRSHRACRTRRRFCDLRRSSGNRRHQRRDYCLHLHRAMHAHSRRRADVAGQSASIPARGLDRIVALRPELRCRDIIDYRLLPTLDVPKQKAEFSNRNPARLAACRHDSGESRLPTVLGAPKEQYVPLVPHSSTRCGKAEVLPKPAKRRSSRPRSHRDAKAKDHTAGRKRF
jgi:hypothetical protein